MKPEQDAYGNIIRDIYNGDNPDAKEIVEREDGYIEAGDAQYLFNEYEEWDDDVKQALTHVNGKVVDVGCGAGRHSLYLQEQGHDVYGVDISPLAVDIASQRGVENTSVETIDSIHSMSEAPFDTVLLLGNNFGLLGSKPVERLRKLYETTTDEGTIVAQVHDHTNTDNDAHLGYHKFNEARNRRPGCLKMRIRYEHFQTEWFNYLFVDYNEFQDIISQTPWTETQKYVTEDGFTSILE